MCVSTGPTWPLFPLVSTRSDRYTFTTHPSDRRPRYPLRDVNSSLPSLLMFLSSLRTFRPLEVNPEYPGERRQALKSLSYSEGSNLRVNPQNTQKDPSPGVGNSLKVSRDTELCPFSVTTFKFFIRNNFLLCVHLFTCTVFTCRTTWTYLTYGDSLVVGLFFSLSMVVRSSRKSSGREKDGVIGDETNDWVDIP